VEDRILIVDDEPMISDILARRLAKEGYACIRAKNGKEALQYFYKDSFSLIISDIKMPEMGGLELLRKVKTMSPKIMVIMITAYPEIDMAVEAMRLGAYDFITKPVTLDLVVLSVKNAL
jgi:DNA-binding NtrC family response regulator